MKHFQAHFTLNELMQTYKMKSDTNLIQTQHKKCSSVDILCCKLQLKLIFSLSLSLSEFYINYNKNVEDTRKKYIFINNYDMKTHCTLLQAIHFASVHSHSAIHGKLMHRKSQKL